LPVLERSCLPRGAHNVDAAVAHVAPITGDLYIEDHERIGADRARQAGLIW